MGIQALQNHACLVLHGEDKQGLVAAGSALIARHNGNIVALDQYSDNPHGGHFFQRMSFHCPELHARWEAITADLEASMPPLGLSWRLIDQSIPKRMAILVSKPGHCLTDLLWRHARQTLQVDIPLVISNHPDHAGVVESFDIPYHVIPSPPGTNKAQVEAQVLRLLHTARVDFVVLARYMQILSADFLAKVNVPLINIHHSFLPAFVGANPYKQAKDRGVKLIGATAHYVTSELDQGPIIEQDTARVNHAMSAADLCERGAFVERAVLSRAVAWHAADRVIRHHNHTIVFA